MRPLPYGSGKVRPNLRLIVQLGAASMRPLPYGSGKGTNLVTGRTVELLQ